MLPVAKSVRARNKLREISNLLFISAAILFSDMCVAILCGMRYSTHHTTALV